ncbi:MAG: hypothetical protein IKO05_12100 [Selenomonadaceae bacterium]|nr:hypothetical protein [Selenomonadaceae bacterium]
MIGYKGFDKDLKCKGFQYRVGETYKFDGEIKICERGFHFCDIPTAVFEYYSPADSHFALVEATGSIADDGKHKFCTDEIKIVKELTLAEMAGAITDKEVNTGYHSAASNTGACSAASNTGSHSAASNTGSYSAASVSGKSSVAAVFGRASKAKGALGCWLVLSEWNNSEIKDMQCFKVDGEIIKADVFYTLRDGKPVEADKLEE